MLCPYCSRPVTILQADYMLDTKMLKVQATTSYANSILTYGDANGPFGSPLTSAQKSFLTTQLAGMDNAVDDLTDATARNGLMQKRLESALSASYGTELNLNVEIDPSILGGVKVQVAGEIIDGSVVARLNQAKMQLA